MKEMRFTVFSALSLAFHALLVLGFWLWTPTFFLSTKTQRPIEVVYVKKEKKKEKESPEKTFVKQVQVPDNLKFEDPNEAQFTSEVRQRVLQETRAQISGLTKNRDHGPCLKVSSFLFRVLQEAYHLLPSSAGHDLYFS